MFREPYIVLNRYLISINLKQFIYKHASMCAHIFPSKWSILPEHLDGRLLPSLCIGPTCIFLVTQPLSSHE